VAAYLAQEGLELVRNIRDSNWMTPGTGWRDNIDNRSYIIDYNDNSLNSDISDPYLYINNGFYSHDRSGAKTIFQRVISISTPSSDCDGNKCILASSTVTWSDFGTSGSTTVSERLYNWFKQ
jgi:hypothetical protein